MEFAIVTSPAAAIRRKPRHTSEMVNQLLFGETVQIMRNRDDLWVKIRSLHDGYEGWTTTTLLEPVDQEFAKAYYPAVTGSFLSEVKLGERVMQIPMGSTIPRFNGTSGSINGTLLSVDKAMILTDKVDNKLDFVLQQSRRWLDVPYLWGGRTPLGVDCSGYMQVLFKMAGLNFPRDAWQQAQEGLVIKKFRQAVEGDLLFFDAKEDIVHVGMLVEPGLMIHSSGRVKLDEVDKKGLVRPEARSRRLSLRLIRRILP